MTPPGWRRLMVVRGSAAHTARAAAALVARLPDRDVLWVGEGTERFAALDAAGVRGRLGLGFDAVVVSLHQAVDADLLGLTHGFVWGGGALILRMPPTGSEAPGRERLAVHPHVPDDVGQRFWRRIDRWASAHGVAPTPVGPVGRATTGTAEQARGVARLVAVLGGPDPARVVLTADRGRGKSSALGLALARLPDEVRVGVTAESEAALVEVLRFAGPRARMLEPGAVLDARDLDVIVVDEAARMPVPWLQRLVRVHPKARIAFASTVRGYEGTGRGFALRFVRWLERQDVPVETLSLEAPIRFAVDDPLERAVFSLLALDAPLPPGDARVDPGAATHQVLERDALAADEDLLRAVFGLLVHAHYRTTPADLHRLLDAPNLAVHALMSGGVPLAASVIAAEGGLPPEVCDGLARGRHRIRGHALPETLIVHLGHVEAGALRMWRSVRIASHPARRRGGLGARLVEAVHGAAASATDPLDLIGTLFGATTELLRWRRSLGYELVRVGVSHGSRTGEPAAVMVRPLSPAGRALVATLRAELARDLPLQLRLLAADGELALDPALRDALTVALPAPAPLSEQALRDTIEAYVHGPRPFDTAACAVHALVEGHPAALAASEAGARALIEARVVRLTPWRSVARDLGYPTVPAAMRALRRAVRELWGRVV